jgi:ABC-type multidrug transport system fused ATPase/permease subunit
MKKFKKILYLLSTRERKSALLLLMMITVMALLDTIGVASILPFIAVLTNPDVIETNVILSKTFQVSNKFGIETNSQFLFALGIFVFLLLVISLTFKAITIYAQTRFVQMRQYSISKRIVEDYIHQPYSWFLNRNSADLERLFYQK